MIKTSVTIHVSPAQDTETRPGLHGWCAVLRAGPNVRPLSGSDHHTTAQRMAVTAVIHALRALHRPSHLTVRSTSERLISAGQAGSEAAAAGPETDLWNIVSSLNEKHTLEWELIPGTDEDSLTAQELVLRVAQQTPAATAVPAIVKRPTDVHAPADAEPAEDDEPEADLNISRVTCRLDNGLKLHVERQGNTHLLSLWGELGRVGYPTVIDAPPYTDVIIQQYRIDHASLREMIGLLSTSAEGSEAAPSE